MSSRASSRSASEGSLSPSPDDGKDVKPKKASFLSGLLKRYGSNSSYDSNGSAGVKSLDSGGSVLTDPTSPPEPGGTDVYMCSMKGATLKSDENEDRVFSCTVFLSADAVGLPASSFEEQVPAACFGVVDGHGGPGCAAFLARRMPELMAANGVLAAAAEEAAAQGFPIGNGATGSVRGVSGSGDCASVPAREENDGVAVVLPPPPQRQARTSEQPVRQGLTVAAASPRPPRPGGGLPPRSPVNSTRGFAPPLPPLPPSDQALSLPVIPVPPAVRAAAGGDDRLVKTLSRALEWALGMATVEFEGEVAAAAAGGGTAAGDMSGACILVALFCGGELVLANIGDCRALFCGRLRRQPGIFTTLHTPMHNSQNNNEVARFLAAGGYLDPAGRFQGELGPSRTIGDMDTKSRALPGTIISMPSVHPVGVSPTPSGRMPSFVVLGTDGLWDQITDNQAETLVKKWYKKDRKSPDGDPAQLLVAKAKTREGYDDTTAVVAVFHF